MTKRMAALALFLLLIMTCTSALAAQWATVNNPDPADRLNLRARPSTSAISYGKYYNGTQVQILSGPSRGWYRVRVGLGNGISEVEGYMKAKYLAVGDDAADVQDARPRVTLRSEDGKDIRLVDFHTGSNVGKVQSGQLVTVLGVGSKFLHVVSGSSTGVVPVELATPRLYFSDQDR